MPRIYNPNVSLIKHSEWMRKTNAGVLAVRGKELEAIDKRLLRFERATTDYGKEWEGNELRIEFDIYARKYPNWKDSDRNKSGAFTDLDFSLKLMGLDAPLPAGQDSLMAVNLRQGVLYFLSHLKTDIAPSDWGAFINDAIDGSSDVHDLVQTGKAQGGLRATAGATAQTSGPQGADGFLKSVIASLQDYLKDIAGPVNGLMLEAVRAIANALPELVKQVLGALLQNLGAALDIAGNLVKAGRAAVATFSSRHLEEGVMSGHPRIVVTSVRDQIKDSGWDAVKDAVKTALVTGINVANPIAGTVVSAIAAIYKFVTDLYSRIKDRVKLRGLITDSKTKLTEGLHLEADQFNTWFKSAISDLPILSCYCMCMPMTGGYYGFLTLVTADNTQMSCATLERNYGEFNDVKVWARKFVKSDKITLKSDDNIVKHSIKVARGEQDSEFKGGLAARVKKTAISMVENAAKG
jgi:hypothetical protein